MRCIKAGKLISRRSINATAEARQLVNHGSGSLRHGGTNDGKVQRGLNSYVKAILILVASLAGFLDHAMGGWGKAITMASAAIVVPVLLLQYRRFWNQGRFWITVCLLTTVQVPIVFAVHPAIERAGTLYMLAFGTIDGLFVIAVIFFVCWKTD
jgi:hypothetical protein